MKPHRQVFAAAALCATLSLTLSSCGEATEPQAPAAATTALQAEATRRLEEIAARPDLEPAIADFLREAVAIGLEYNIKATDAVASRTLDDRVRRTESTRDHWCVRVGQGSWGPGPAITTMWGQAVDELARGLLKDRNVEDQAVASVAAGRILTAIDQFLCQSA